LLLLFLCDWSVIISHFLCFDFFLHRFKIVMYILLGWFLFRVLASVDVGLILLVVIVLV
jgi:hypothetical protein